MKITLKTGGKLSSKELENKRLTRKKNSELPYLERKEKQFKKLGNLSEKQQVKKKIKYYKKQRFYAKYKIRAFVDNLASKEIKFIYLDFLRWVLVDWIRGRRGIQFGIYSFVALPGQGKTMSMVSHMQRYRSKMNQANKAYVIVTNFSYAHADFVINDWLDLVKISNDCYKKNLPILVAWDEIHVTFDSSDWKDFPSELLAILSFVRKYGMEFLCSAQIYERIPKKIRDITNFVVVCKNIWRKDRLFRNYYYEKENYEMDFADTKGKKQKAKFIREFVASDSFFELYDTRQQVERMVDSAKQEKKKREEAAVVLFSSRKEED